MTSGRLRPILVTASETEIVTLDQAKEHLRVDHTDEDALIEGLIGAVEALFDGWSGILGLALCNQTWRQDFRFLESRMDLPLSPAASITNVKYYDASNVLQTASASLYQLLADERGPYVSRVFNQTWPTVYGREVPVQVTFVAGFGAAASDVPGPIRQAMLLLIGHWFENREAVVINATVADLPMAVQALIAPFRHISFGG